MGFLLESPVQLADSHLPHLSTPRGALHPSFKVILDILERRIEGPRSGDGRASLPARVFEAVKSDTFAHYSWLRATEAARAVFALPQG
jgi:hypothetical protein